MLLIEKNQSMSTHHSLRHIEVTWKNSKHIEKESKIHALQPIGSNHYGPLSHR